MAKQRWTDELAEEPGKIMESKYREYGINEAIMQNNSILQVSISIIPDFPLL